MLSKSNPWSPKTQIIVRKPPKASQYVCTLLAKELVKDIADGNVYTISAENWQKNSTFNAHIDRL